MDSMGIGTVAKRAGVSIDTVIAALMAVRDGLSQLVEACPGHGSAADCPILKALGVDDES